MATSEERLKILTMIQEGKISAEDGLKLLEALDSQAETGTKSSEAESCGSTGGKGGRWLRVLVTDTDSGKRRVNIRLPISVVTAGMKMGARFSPEVEGLDMSQMEGFIRAGITGKIVDVYDDEDGEHIEVFIE